MFKSLKQCSIRLTKSGEIRTAYDGNWSSALKDKTVKSARVSVEFQHKKLSEITHVLTLIEPENASIAFR